MLTDRIYPDGPTCEKCGALLTNNQCLAPQSAALHESVAQSEADNHIDFALMIRRLAARIQKYEPNSEMAKQALSLLEKKGIKSWPLR